MAMKGLKIIPRKLAYKNFVWKNISENINSLINNHAKLIIFFEFIILKLLIITNVDFIVIIKEINEFINIL